MLRSSDLFLDDSDNFHRRPGRNERRIRWAEGLLWGRLLRLELEEGCAVEQLKWLGWSEMDYWRVETVEGRDF